MLPVGTDVDEGVRLWYLGCGGVTWCGFLWVSWWPFHLAVWMEDFFLHQMGGGLLWFPVNVTETCGGRVCRNSFFPRKMLHTTPLMVNCYIHLPH